MSHDNADRDGHGRFTRTLRGAERDAQAARLRQAGASYQDIANAMGMANKSGAFRACQRAIASACHEDGEALRRLTDDRLDRLLRAVWPAAIRGDVKAVDRCVRIIDQSCRLHGIYPAEKVQFTEDAIDAEIARLTAELRGTVSPETEA